MLRYLGTKFWMRVILLGLLVATIVMGPRGLKAPAKLTYNDEVSSAAASPRQVYSPASGLTYELESKLDNYIEQLTITPAAQDWRHLHQEWFALSKQFFERLYGDPAVYNKYVELWLAKRQDMQSLRLNSRREFFPDMTDRELFDRIDWLREQDEWNEMQAKIHQGIERIDHDYTVALQELLGHNYAALSKLHEIFMQDNMAAELSVFYFL